MTLLDDMRDDLDAMYEEFGEEATLNGAEILAIVGDIEPTSERQLPINNHGLSISVRLNQVAGVSRGDKVVIRDKTYKVMGNPEPDRLEWQLDLTREMTVSI